MITNSTTQKTFKKYKNFRELPKKHSACKDSKTWKRHDKRAIASDKRANVNNR